MPVINNIEIGLYSGVLRGGQRGAVTHECNVLEVSKSSTDLVSKIILYFSS